MEYELKELGARVRDLRVRAGMTQEDLAAKSGLDQSHISKIERGARAQIYRTTIAALAAALGTTPSYLEGRPTTADPAHVKASPKFGQAVRRLAAQPPEVRAEFWEIYRLLSEAVEDAAIGTGESES